MHLSKINKYRETEEWQRGEKEKEKKCWHIWGKQRKKRKEIQIKRKQAKQLKIHFIMSKTEHQQPYLFTNTFFAYAQPSIYHSLLYIGLFHLFLYVNISILESIKAGKISMFNRKYRYTGSLIERQKIDQLFWSIVRHSKNCN